MAEAEQTTQRYRLEFRPTIPPRPLAIWDCIHGSPGGGGAMIADFGPNTTMPAAELICEAMNIVSRIGERSMAAKIGASDG